MALGYSCAVMELQLVPIELVGRTVQRCEDWLAGHASVVDFNNSYSNFALVDLCNVELAPKLELISARVDEIVAETRPQRARLQEVIEASPHDSQSSSAESVRLSGFAGTFLAEEIEGGLLPPGEHDAEEIEGDLHEPAEHEAEEIEGAEYEGAECEGDEYEGDEYGLEHAAPVSSGSAAPSGLHPSQPSCPPPAAVLRSTIAHLGLPEPPAPPTPGMDVLDATDHTIIEAYMLDSSAVAALRRLAAATIDGKNKVLAKLQRKADIAKPSQFVTTAAKNALSLWQSKHGR